jgi:RNA-directed DNA polymerase
MLKAGFIEDLQYFETQEGTPQGGIVSPLLANVYMHRLDEYMYERFHNITPEKRYQRRKRGELISVRFIRYADDFVVLMRDGERAAELKKELADFIGQELKMTSARRKRTLRTPKMALIFSVSERSSDQSGDNPQKVLPYQVPAEKSVKSYRQKVNELTHPIWITYHRESESRPSTG